MRLLKLGEVIMPVSSELCTSRGGLTDHSIDVDIWSLHIIIRWAAKASHKIKMNIRRAVKERSEPKDETAFHFINASG